MTLIFIFLIGMCVAWAILGALHNSKGDVIFSLLLIIVFLLCIAMWG